MNDFCAIIGRPKLGNLILETSDFSTISRYRYLGNLADNVVDFCKDAIQKEAFVDLFGTTKRISLELYEPAKGENVYNRTRNNAGTLTMGINKAKFGTNANQLGKDLLQTCSGDAGLSIASRKNIRDAQVHLDKNIAQLEKASGVQFEVLIDWGTFAPVAKERKFEAHVGDLVYKQYLGAIASHAETLCKDSMGKEAFAEACSKKTISFVLAAPKTEGYGKVTFEDGVLVVTLPAERFGTNCQHLGKDMEKSL